MIQLSQPTIPSAIVYPESDGLPMADNSRQFRLIVELFNNLAALFHDSSDVYVVGNMFWYPVEGETEIRAAPDVLVIFGRPKGHRSSYRQWEEDNVPVQVVFEILSPKNTPQEMTDKAIFYEEYGVEEYYLYNPEEHHLSIYHRRGQFLRRVYNIREWVSPRLGIRFDLSEPELVVYRPDGQRFQTFEEIQTKLTEQAKLLQDALQRTEQEKQRAEQEKQRAEQEKQRAEQEKQRAEQASEQAEQARRYAARLAELSRKVRRGQASPEELAELERLEE